MTDYYEVRLYDTSFALRNVLQKWDRLSFTQRLDGAWNHEIFFDLSSEDDYCDLLRNDVDADWLVRFIRYDPENVRPRKIVYSGFNRTVVEQATSEGNIQFSLYGSGLTDLINRRIVVPPTGYESSDKTGIAETIMKEFVDETCITPTDADRIIPNLANESDNFYGNVTTYSARYTQLMTVLTNLANDGDVHFGIVENTDSSGNDLVGDWLFRVKPVWGTDRRIGNPDLNAPTLFSMEFNNMIIPIFSRNNSDERNFVYAGGVGVGVDRLIVSDGDTTDIARSPWNRHEGFLNAARESTIAALQTLINSELVDKVPKPTLNFTINETDGTRWLVDWELGDLVTADYFGNRFDKEIYQVDVSVTGNRKSRTELITAKTRDI